jgi:phasin family protein
MAQKFELPKTDDFLTPFKAFNDLALANAEKLVSMQTKNFEKYSKIALTSMQEAAEVTDIEASQAFFAKQNEVTKQVAEGFAADLKVFAEFGQSYTDDLQKVAKTNIEKVSKK